MKVQLLILTPSDVLTPSLAGMIAIGGKSCTGISCEDLRYKDDYAVVAVQGDQIVVHPLKGDKREALVLKENIPFRIDDLTLVRYTPLAQKHASQELEGDIFGEIIREFAETRDLTESFSKILKALKKSLMMEKGLIITKDIQNQFSVVAALGVDPTEPWLSESLIQKTLSTQKPQIVGNIIGSTFNSKQSLIATGFLSVFCWPLIVRGDCLGALLVASTKPHSGLSESDQQQAQLLVQLAALLLSFQLRDSKQKAELTVLRNRLHQDSGPFLSTDHQMIETCRVAEQVSDSDLSIFIHGETGVGKELLSSWIHSKSPRNQKPFVVLNCGAIPAELLESQLFGHRRGSFTGAVNDQVGKFQLADKGTLFLDEIGDLPLHLQVKLLRVLQEKELEPLGAKRSIPIDIRVISASHKDLKSLVASGQFREDLYYRLAELTLYIPSLRERPQDIGPLAVQFLKEFKSSKTFSASAMNWLQSQNWKGNVRELRSGVKRAAILAKGEEILKSDLDYGRNVGSEEHWLGGRNLEEAKESFVKEKVNLALIRVGGNRKRAAELLGVTPRTLFRYLEEKSEFDGTGSDQDPIETSLS